MQHEMIQENKYAQEQNVPVLKLNNGTLVVESNYFHNVSNTISGTKQAQIGYHVCSCQMRLMLVVGLTKLNWMSNCL